MNTLTINNVSPKRSLYQHFLILPKHEAKHEREWKIKTETQHTPPLGGWIVSFVMEFYMKYKIVNLRVPVPQDPDELSTKELNLDVIGLMVLPPNNQNTKKYFKELYDLNNSLALSELSMGMSSDYLDAVNCKATFIRVGSLIFGPRS